MDIVTDTIHIGKDNFNLFYSFYIVQALKACVDFWLATPEDQEPKPILICSSSDNILFSAWVPEIARWIKGVYISVVTNLRVCPLTL